MGMFDKKADGSRLQFLSHLVWEAQSSEIEWKNYACLGYDNEKYINWFLQFMISVIENLFLQLKKFIQTRTINLKLALEVKKTGIFY